MTKPCDLSAVEARRLIGNKQLSPVELLDSCLERIADVNGTLNAVVTLDAEQARQTAADAEAAVMDGELLDLLHGLPVGVKDLEATAGLRTTWGSLLYKDHVPDADDSMVANVRDAGAVILGKTNTPEFGAGANTRNLVFGATGNPFDPVKTCGGSSGGSAVALAAGMLPLATGSDYGGSLRTPASFCGVVGFRPSPGLVPAAESAVSLNPFAVLGPMGRSVADAHLLFKAQLDSDKADPFSGGDWMGVPETLGQVDLGGLTVALSADLGCAPIDASIRETFEARSKIFSSVFGEVQQRDPELEDVHESFEILRGVNFVAAHRERLESGRDLLGPNVIDNTERGLAYSAGDVAWAHTVHTRMYRKFLALFDEVDVLICPGAGVSPFPHEQLYLEEVGGEVMPTYTRWFAMTYVLSMVLPSVCVLPCGLDHLGLPFGIQVVGPNGADGQVLEVAHALEQVLAGNPETARPLPDLAALSS